MRHITDGWKNGIHGKQPPKNILSLFMQQIQEMTNKCTAFKHSLDRAQIPDKTADIAVYLQMQIINFEAIGQIDSEFQLLFVHLGPKNEHTIGAYAIENQAIVVDAKRATKKTHFSINFVFFVYLCLSHTVIQSK